MWRTFIAIAVVGILIGVAAVIAGLWLIWDLVNTMAWWLATGRSWESFYFPFPFFSGGVDHTNWTLAFDIGMTFIIVGCMLVGVFSYLLGWIVLMRHLWREVERSLEEGKT